MLNWLLGIFAGAAFDAAIYSADCASIGGMHQMKEPESLQKIVKECKTKKN